MTGNAVLHFIIIRIFTTSIWLILHDIVDYLYDSYRVIQTGQKYNKIHVIII